MPVLTPTKADGATARPNEVLYVDPACQVTEEVLAEQMSVGTMNAVFMADLLSGMLAHERCGVHLYRAVAARSNSPMLQRRYEEFGDETRHHVAVLEQVITTLGGNPNYVSPTARAVHGMDSNLVESTFMLNGALDVMTREMAMLDAVFLAESMDQANWQLLSQLVDSMEGDARETLRAAVEEVEGQEDEHLEWARSTKARLVTLQATGSMTATVGLATEELIARVQNWLND
jgi:rubrerythrin